MLQKSTNINNENINEKYGLAFEPAVSLIIRFTRRSWPPCPSQSTARRRHLLLRKRRAVVLDRMVRGADGARAASKPKRCAAREVRILEMEACNSWAVASALLWADQVVVCRLPGTYPVLRTMGLARRMGLTVYYDIDDLIFDQEHFPPHCWDQSSLH